jgi:hypothetical protein
MTKTFKSILPTFLYFYMIGCGPHINPVDENSPYVPPGSTQPTPTPTPDTTEMLTWKEVSLPYSSYKKISGIQSPSQQTPYLFLITTQGTGPTKTDTLYRYKTDQLAGSGEAIMSERELNDAYFRDWDSFSVVGYSNAPESCVVIEYNSHKNRIIPNIYGFNDGLGQNPDFFCHSQRGVSYNPKTATIMSVGEGGIFVTRDKWRNVYSQPAGMKRTFYTSNLNAIWGGGGTFWAVGDRGMIATTQDQDIPWTVYQVLPLSLTTPNLTAIAGMSSNDILTVGEHGIVFHYDGTSWIQVDTRTLGSINLTSIYAMGANAYYIGGENGKFISYINETWKVDTLPTTQPILSIFAFSEQNIYAMTASKIFQYTIK